MPQRVKVEGDLFHDRVPEGAVYVGRSAPGLKRSLFANPHRVGKACSLHMGGDVVHDLQDSLNEYRRHLLSSPTLLEEARQTLVGRDLACWCRLPEPGEPDLCHGALLLSLTNFSSAQQIQDSSTERGSA